MAKKKKKKQRTDLTNKAKGTHKNGELKAKLNHIVIEPIWWLKQAEITCIQLRILKNTNWRRRRHSDRLNRANSAEISSDQI